jgi:hypothetical protein
MTTYAVTIEDAASNERYTRDFLASSREAALTVACRSLMSEKRDYYVIAITRK